MTERSGTRNATGFRQCSTVVQRGADRVHCQNAGMDFDGGRPPNAFSICSLAILHADAHSIPITIWIAYERVSIAAGQSCALKRASSIPPCAMRIRSCSLSSQQGVSDRSDRLGVSRLANALRILKVIQKLLAISRSFSGLSAAAFPGSGASCNRVTARAACPRRPGALRVDSQCPWVWSVCSD